MKTARLDLQTLRASLPPCYENRESHRDREGQEFFSRLLVIADLMRGTGRYNLAFGAIATMQGIGASLSGLAAGVLVDHFGYSITFLTLGAAAGLTLLVFALGMPETADRDVLVSQDS